MLTRTRSDFTPAVLSTVTDLTIVPLLPARLTVTLMGPFVPGARCHGCSGNCATVHPQEVRTLLIRTTSFETFVRLKVKCALGSPGLAEYSFDSESQAR